ncbi:MAG TPA: hypothetical protein VEB65_07785 [Solirubrobacterales bacterium]|nr:hypothetical protein [Solirubrobacterales bacterium]
MALSDDQRAMLRLLAQREQGYEEMAALMGVSVEELRGRVKEALAELETEGKEAPQLPPEPEAPKAAPEEPKVEAEAPKAPAPPPNQPRRGVTLPSSTGARIGAAAIGAAVVVVVVLLLVLGGGDGNSDSTTGTTTVNSAEAASGTLVQKAIASTETKAGKESTRAILQPDNGNEAQGVAIFGRLKKTLALQVIAENLEPLPAGQAYAIWIAQSPTRMLPLALSPVRKNGTIASQFEVPTELLAYLANETFDEIAVTQASVSRFGKALKEATKAEETPSYTGTPVMRGEITGPIVGAAKRTEEEKGGGGK